MVFLFGVVWGVLFVWFGFCFVSETTFMLRDTVSMVQIIL